MYTIDTDKARLDIDLIHRQSGFTDLAALERHMERMVVNRTACRGRLSAGPPQNQSNDESPRSMWRSSAARSVKPDRRWIKSMSSLALSVSMVYMLYKFILRRAAPEDLVQARGRSPL
ncbi:MAG TPA: hypothetical protein VGJ88_11595, partial [Thermoanaerobaculia bacterium]